MTPVRKRVYIATPISRGCLLSNVAQADAAMLALMRAGFAPFNPALSVYAGGAVSYHEGDKFLNAVGYAASSFPDVTHDDWLQMDFAWVAASDAVLRLPGDSLGADRETAFATAAQIPVFHSLEDLFSYFHVAN